MRYAAFGAGTAACTLAKQATIAMTMSAAFGVPAPQRRWLEWTETAVNIPALDTRPLPKFPQSARIFAAGSMHDSQLFCSLHPVQSAEPGTCPVDRTALTRGQLADLE
jgi:hypothetical protein